MLILTAKNEFTFMFLKNHFNFKSMFHADDSIGFDFYFNVDGQSDADATEQAIEKELKDEKPADEMLCKNLSYYFEFEEEIDFIELNNKIGSGYGLYDDRD